MNEGDVSNLVAGLSIATGPGVEKVACLCSKLVDVRERSRLVYSGIVNYRECLCPDCAKEFDLFARVVCLKCKKLQLFMKPQRDSHGFVILPRMHLHIGECHSCAPAGTNGTPLIERQAWYREHKIPTNVDLDIVQEAEQKRLQGQKVVDKLRVDFQSTPPTS